MDEDTILDSFLCLGGTDKTQGDTGGFGIAKAVILGGCTWWELRRLSARRPQSAPARSPPARLPALPS